MGVKNRWHLFVLMLLIFSTGIISATELKANPEYLKFNIEINKETCMFFVISANNYSGDLYSMMKWADINTQASTQEDFKFINSETNLTILYYPPTITNFSKEEYIDICIKGNNTGYWEGILEYKDLKEESVKTKLIVNITKYTKEELQEFEEQRLLKEQQRMGMTGKAIEFTKTNNGKTTIGITLTIIILAIGMFTWKKTVKDKKK